jgi:hypothetical protein
MSKEFNKALKYLMKNPEGDSIKLLGKIRDIKIYENLYRGGFIEHNEYCSSYKLTQAGIKHYNESVSAPIKEAGLVGKLRFAFINNSSLRKGL